MNRLYFALCLSAFTSALLISPDSARADSVDIQNGALGGGSTPNALLSSNGGLSTDQFKGVVDNGVSLWLRARNRGDQGPDARIGDVFQIDPDEDHANTDPTDFSFEFQFSPEDGDTINSNYWLKLQVDGDPTSGTDFTSAGATLSRVIIDSNSDDPDSWDDHDSFVEDGASMRGGSPVDFVLHSSSNRNKNDLPAYVVVNSWLPKWSFLMDGVPGPGNYDIVLNAYTDDPSDSGTLLATNSIEVEVVPEPASLALFGVGGLALFARRRRQS